MKKCPLKYTLSFIKSKWTLLIIRELLIETQRFSELKRNITGISQKVLTTNLRFLEEHKIINRIIYPIIPPKVEYSITELGKSLEPVLNAMKDWATENMD